MQARLTILAFLIASQQAAAQSSWPIDPEGHLSFGFTDRIPDAPLFLSGNADVDIRFGRSPLGLSIGVYGYIDEADSPHETYGALTWDIPNAGRLSVGVPRPAYDLVAVSALERSFPTLGADRAHLTRSQVTWGAMEDGYLPYGVTFESSGGAIEYAFSLHDTPNKDTTTAGVGLSYTRGTWTVAVGLESSWGDDDVSNAKAGIGFDQGKAHASATLYAPGASGLPTFAELGGGYRLSNVLSAEGAVQIPFDGSALTAGIAGRYAMSPAMDLSVGVATEDGDDATFNALIDFNF